MGTNMKALKIQSWIYLIGAIAVLAGLAAAMA